MLSLQQLDDDDIMKIEQMAKTQLIDFLDENKESNNFVEYFGPIYQSKPDQFAFTCGDKKMLKQLSVFVQTTIRQKGYTYFQAENRQRHQNSNRHGANIRDASEEQLQEELFNAVLNLLQPYGDHVSSLFKKEMVVIKKENGEIKGLVRCVVCDTDTEPKKRRRRTEYYSQYWNGHKWILSNFANHHLNKVHLIAKNENQAPKENEIDGENSQTSSAISTVDDHRNVKNPIDICMQHLRNFRNDKSIDSHFVFNSVAANGPMKNDSHDTLPAPRENNSNEEDPELMSIRSKLPPDGLISNSNAENLMADERM